MSFSEVMNIMLPPTPDGVSTHVTSQGNFGNSRSSGPHGGVDFNYEGGQTGVNLTHPTVFSPVAGEVTFSGECLAAVLIDAGGSTGNPTIGGCFALNNNMESPLGETNG